MGHPSTADRPETVRPGVLPGDRSGARRRQALREWLRAPGPFAVALAIHAALIGWYWGREVLGSDGREPPVLSATMDETTEPIEPEPEPEPPELEPVEVPVDVVPEIEIQDERREVDVRPEADLLGLGGSLGSGRVRGRGLDRGPSLREAADVSTARSAFREFVDDLRGRGLDVVFVMDATGSMQRFIDRARETIDRIVADLAAVVPSLRLGIVAYRDLADDWVTRRVDLTPDRWAIHNFLIDLEAAGGKRVHPDFEEAVEVGLAVAADELAWRDEARQVILVVGDAPFHDEDRSAALATVRSFARSRHAVVNAVYVGAGREGQPTENQRRALEAMEQIARTGGGRAFELMTDDEAAGRRLRERVLEATFGSAWMEDVLDLLENVPDDPRLASIARHVEGEDRAWLVRRLRADAVHPGVVAGAIQLFDGRIARACLALLEDESRPRAARSAALHVLKRSLDELHGLPLDPAVALSVQPVVLAAVRRAVGRVPDAPTLPPPAPGPDTLPPPAPTPEGP